MTEPIAVALDVMGGDHGLDSALPAAVAGLAADPDLRLVLVGDERRIRPRLAELGAAESERLAVRHAAEQIAMDESPLQALRGKKDSSMRAGLELLVRTARRPSSAPATPAPWWRCRTTWCGCCRASTGRRCRPRCRR